MEYVSFLMDFILHIDKHLAEIIGQYGVWTYAILIAIIFAETGLVVTPFLPGDSLLFAAGAIAAATGVLDIHLLVLLLIAAAILGDLVNYHIGKAIGPKVFAKDLRWLKRQHLVRTQEFYEKHGGKTIIIARFMPIIRTFAPFVAGIGTMSYSRFAMYNVVGAIVWVASFAYLGFMFGNNPFIKKNFTLVILAIIIISVLPGVIEYIRHKRKGTAA